MRTLTSWQLPTRLLGVAMVVAAGGSIVARDPQQGGLLLFFVASFGWWAAPPIVSRPAQYTGRWYVRLSRHRNTVLAGVCIVLATLGTPSLGSAAAVTGLLLGYLLLLDARGRSHQPPGPLAALSAGAAAALVLLAAFLPTASSSWARLPAALGVAVAALAVGAALRARRHPSPESDN